MNDIVDLLLKYEMVFKKLHPIDNKALGTRKKVAIYEGVDLDSNYVAIFYLVQKSRFLRKDAEVLETLLERLIALQGHRYKKKILFYRMPICSKAKALMQERGWRLIDVAA